MNEMKRIINLVVISIIAIEAFGGCKVVSGDVQALKNVGYIEVVCDWSNAVYNKTGTLQDFLWESGRSANWEEVCIKTFANESSSFTVDKGIRFVSQKDARNAEYILIIVTDSISSGGDIKGNIIITPHFPKYNDQIVISFSSDDADEDDKIVFGDQFESIGKSLGKLLLKKIK